MQYRVLVKTYEKLFVHATRTSIAIHYTAIYYSMLIVRNIFNIRFFKLSNYSNSQLNSGKKADTQNCMLYQTYFPRGKTQFRNSLWS